MKSNSSNSQIKLFGMQNLLLESELKKLEVEGIDIGHMNTLVKKEVVDSDLFESDIRINAKRMADFYSTYYCLENTVRRLIRGTLSEKYGSNWWNLKVPDIIRTEVKKKQDHEKDSVMSIRSEDPLSYSNFGELIPIIESNWQDFSDKLRSKKAVAQTLSQFNQVRNVLAHSCSLNDDEIMRFNLLVRDWLRQQT